jgi:hypothetical protein
MSSPKEYLVEVCAFAAFSNYCLELQRLKKRAKNTVDGDLKPMSDFDLLLNNSTEPYYINPAQEVCEIPSNRSIIAYQELGIMIIFDNFQFLHANSS